MRLFLIALVLIIYGAIRHAQTEPTKEKCSCSGHTYEIQAVRTNISVPRPAEHLFIINRTTPMQDLIYNMDVDKENPFDIEGGIKLGDLKIREIEGVLHSCDDSYDNPWDYFIVEVIRKEYMPTGSCPVKAGMYEIPQKLDPISVTFDSMLKCGDYELNVHVTSRDYEVLKATFSFNIPNNGDCISA